jgi:hypothetical protein
LFKEEFVEMYGADHMNQYAEWLSTGEVHTQQDTAAAAKKDDSAAAAATATAKKSTIIKPKNGRVIPPFKDGILTLERKRFVREMTEMYYKASLLGSVVPMDGSGLILIPVNHDGVIQPFKSGNEVDGSARINLEAGNATFIARVQFDYIPVSHKTLDKALRVSVASTGSLGTAKS